jgi:hypothetical protein
MSYDFLVATRTRPAATAIEAFGRARDLDLRLSGDARPGANVLVTRVDRPVERTIDVDGPVRVEPDDLPDDLAGVVTRPAWLIEIHVPRGYDERVDRWALDLAIHLARDGDGAVFDPQAERIAWPPGVTPRKPGASEERIRLVELVWYLPHAGIGSDAVRRFLDLVADAYPAVRPVRFGAFEPFQGRLDRDGADVFVAAWQEQAAIEFGGMLFWSAQAPGVNGSVSFPDRRDDRRPARLGRVARLSTTVDARPLYRDPGSREAVIELFSTVAAELNAAYAAGCVLRDAILRRGKVGYDARSEMVPLPRSRWWVGLPALPTWLAWFGSAYRGLVEHHVDPSMVVEGRSGILLRCGTEPMDVDELLDVFPQLPPELLVTVRSGSSVDRAARISSTLGPPAEPAETIPPID